MKWGISKYNEWIKNGRPVNDEVLTLDISWSNIVSLKGIEKLINLQELYCDDNELISLKGIETLTKLQILECENNQLISLEEI